MQVGHANVQTEMFNEDAKRSLRHRRTGRASLTCDLDPGVQTTNLMGTPDAATSIQWRQGCMPDWQFSPPADDVTRAAVFSDDQLADQAQTCIFQSVALVIKMAARQLLKTETRIERHGLPIIGVNLKFELSL